MRKKSVHTLSVLHFYQGRVGSCWLRIKKKISKQLRLVPVFTGLFSFTPSGEQLFCEQRSVLGLIKVSARPLFGKGGSHPAAVQRTAAETRGATSGRLVLCSQQGFAVDSSVPVVLRGIGGDPRALPHTASPHTRLCAGGAPGQKFVNR